jgi:mycothiol system anti-sigma-R factor
MSCDLTPSVLHGYLDGELDAARAVEFERHLETCRECIAALESQESLRSSLQRVGLYERAPASLREKVRRDLNAASVAVIPPRRLPVQWLALAAAILIVALVGWRVIPGFNRDDYEVTMASEIVDAHLRSLQPGHLTDVTSTDQHTVKPWFDGKLDFSPPVRDFADAGFPLIGGRIDAFRGRTVAALVYGRRKHVVNVFIWPTKEADSAPRSGGQLGSQWIDWRKGGMEMCAVSDVSPADLDALQHLISE